MHSFLPTNKKNPLIYCFVYAILCLFFSFLFICKESMRGKEEERAMSRKHQGNTRTYHATCNTRHVLYCRTLESDRSFLLFLSKKKKKEGSNVGGAFFGEEGNGLLVMSNFYYKVSCGNYIAETLLKLPRAC
jgi:hypothetical protein